MSANPPADAQSVSDLKARVEAERAGRPFLLFRDGTAGSSSSSSSPARRRLGRAPGVVGSRSRLGRCRSRASTPGSSGSQDGWELVDDGLSSNGTFVNEERLSGRRRLSDGDTLRFGNTTVTFRSPERERPGPRGRRPRPPRPQSSSRRTQRRVLAALCRPYKGGSGFASPATDEQIAEELFLSVGAVRTHLKVLYAKLGVEELPPNETRGPPGRAGLLRRPDLRARPLAECSLPGSIFAGYEVESVVGVGGIGILYRARQLRLDRPVALKLVEPEMARDPVCGSGCAARPERSPRSTTPTSSRCTRRARRTEPSTSSRGGSRAPSSAP